MRSRSCAFLSLAIKRSDAARGPASRIPYVKKQKDGQNDADDRHEETDPDTLRLPPENVRQHRAAQLQLFDVVFSLGDVREIIRSKPACNEEVLGAELGIAGKEHHETTKVDDQERQQDELDRQITWEARVVPEDRTHHELDEQKRDVRLEIARADRLGVSGDQTAIGLSGIGYGFVHPSFGRSAGSGARGVQSPH